MPKFEVVMRCRNEHGTDILTRRLFASKKHKAEFQAVKEMEQHYPEYDAIEPIRTVEIT